jgi:hypothetical protein
MFDSKTFTRDMLSNPNRLTNAVIDAMEATDTGGNLQINDPNNGFVIQLLANNHIFSKFAESVDYTNAFYYSQRARSAEQLYPHLSEFDYINLMAAPATLPFVFGMSKQWIIANSVFFDANYNKIQIPATSSISMGGMTYSMYYPIDILVNRNTGAVTAFYNTEKTNSLYSLESNMLLDVQEYTQDGIEYFQIIFNMFQFQRAVTDTTVSREQGFNRTFTFEDQFYAAKVFTYNTDGTWKELQYSLDKLYYDYKTPTALLTVLSDTSQLKIEIPQIYFSNNQISQTVRVEIYTTKGAINVSLSSADILSRKANFDTQSSVFAAPLVQMPTWLLVPTRMEVVGGSDTKSYPELRDAIVNQRLHSRVPITTPELIEAAVKAGFPKLTRYKDDVTDRMYFASNILTDADGMIIPTFTGEVLITEEYLEGASSTIINYTDGYNTIMPTTVFRITSNTTTCVPLKTSEITTLQAMTKEEQVTELNQGNLVRQPFHITLLTNAKSPYTNVYNLLSPKMKSLSFIRENPNSAPQMSVIACTVEHQNNGTGGFRILMTVDKSSNIENASISNFRIILTAKSKVGEDVFIPATYVGVDNNNNDVWQVILATNYHITTEDFITVMMFDATDTLSEVQIGLEHPFQVLTMFLSSFATEIPDDPILDNQLPNSYIGTNTVMSQQKMILALGKNLSEQIYCGVSTTWGNDVYDTADEDIYYTTNVPIFQTNETGLIVTRRNVSTDAVEVIHLYDIGDVPSASGDFVRKSAIATNPGGVLIRMSDTTGILVGMDVRGTNIPINAKVDAITDISITLDIPAVSRIEADTDITFTNPSPKKRVFVDQNAPGIQISVEDTSDILVGQTVFGFGIINGGSKVLSIDSETEFSLEDATTEAIQEDTLLTFINNYNYGVVKVAQGDVLKDPTGNPIVVKGAANQYSIPTILFDSRLFASDQPSDQAIVRTISERLQGFADQIKTIDSSFIEDANVFYKPTRTMGIATFGIGNSETVRLPLSLSFYVTVYLDPATFTSDVTKDSMSTSIVSIVNEQIQNPLISVSDIANTIKERLGSINASVEMGGINGDDSLRLIALEDTTGSLGIEYTLSILGDGSIDRRPNVNITFLPKPDTSVNI